MVRCLVEVFDSKGKCIISHQLDIIIRLVDIAGVTGSIPVVPTI